MNIEEKLIILNAIEVAIYPPEQQAEHASEARVSWNRINALRAALDNAEIDWRRAKASDDELRAERKAEVLGVQIDISSTGSLADVIVGPSDARHPVSETIRNSREQE